MSAAIDAPIDFLNLDLIDKVDGSIDFINKVEIEKTLKSIIRY